MREVLALEERIAAHADALLGNPEAARASLPPLLGSDDTDDVFAAAYGLLRLNVPSLTEAVVEALATAAPKARAVLTEAICHSVNADAFRVWKARFGQDPARFFTTAEIAAYHAPNDVLFSSIEKLLRDADSATRIEVWRVASLLPSALLRPQDTLAGALDDEPVVRHYALEAAAWAGQTWVLKHCRTAIAKPSADHLEELRLLAIIGAEEDLKPVLLATANPVFGAARYEILGSLGHPEAVDQLILGMGDADVEASRTAGIAFMRITGFQLPTIDRPQKKDEAVDEFYDARVPDGKDASAQWQSAKNKFFQGKRWSGGVEISTPPTDYKDLGAIDMATRWEMNLRLAFSSKQAVRPVGLIRFPCVL